MTDSTDSRGSRGSGGLGQFDEIFLEAESPKVEAEEVTFAERAIGNVVNPLEQIDSVFRRTGHRMWLGVMGILLLVVALVVWAVVADRVVTVSEQIVLLPESGLFPVATLQTGLVGDVLVVEDQAVSIGDLLTTLSIPAVGELAIRSPINGTVVAVDVSEGQIAGPGNTLFLLAPEGEPTMAIGFAGPANLASLAVGQEVTILIPTVNPQRYGRMEGTLTFVGGTPATRSRISAVLGGDAQAVSVLQRGPTYEIRIEPKLGDTASGYVWTVGSGPPARPPLATNGIALVEISRESLAQKVFG